MFRTRLREGASAKPNFAGHYAVVSWGCGPECQQYLVVDLRDSKVYGLAEPPTEPPLGHTFLVPRGVLETSRRVRFRIDSNLLIAGPPCPRDYNPCVSDGRSGDPVRYYDMEQNGLRLIYEVRCRLVKGRQRCGN